MTKNDLIKEICKHPLSDFDKRELESLSASRLRELLDSLNSRHPHMRGDESPEITEEDEVLLDLIWSSIGKSND